MSVSLRMATEADAGALLAIYAPFVLQSPATFELEVPTEADFAARIRGTLSRTPWLVATVGEAVIGYAYAGPHRQRQAYQWGVEASVYLAPAAQGQGLGRRLYSALFDLLRRQGFVHVFAGITLPNRPSVTLHERMGFAPIGVYPQIGFKAGAWHDVGWWRLALRAPPTSPTAPIPLPALGAVELMGA